MMICLPPHGTLPTHSSRHGPQRTQHTASTAATPRYPQGRRQDPCAPPFRQARLAPLLERLGRTLGAIVRVVGKGGWRQQALLAVLGDFSLALAAVLEAPNRSYAPAQRDALLRDLEQLAHFFCDGGLLDQQVVAYSVSPLRALAEAACAS